MKKILLAFVLASTQLQGMDFQTARKNGLIGELPSGYVAAVKNSPSAQIKKIVVDINKRRKAKFTEISNKTGSKSVELVGKTAHDKILKKLSSGAFYKNSSNQWIKK